ncbi:MAG TPA: FecR domain-containing protein [Bacteroidales bacterium]|nr:FecR domain-containing protein [Bacteroidales bacterium]
MMDKLIFKYLKGECSDKEKETLFNWMDQKEDNQAYFNRLRRLWDLNLINSSTNLTPDEIEKAYAHLQKKMAAEKTIPDTTGRKKINISFVRYAAIFVALIGTAFLLYIGQNYRSNQWIEINVPHGKHSAVTLPDGSVVQLNASSQLLYRKYAFKKNRTVKLNGEALFAITKTGRPFIVETRHINIQVTGTKFNLFAFDNETSVEATLLEGVIEFSENNTNGFHHKMVPLQKIVFDSQTRQKKIISNVDVNKSISWVDGVFSFEQTSFAELLSRLERYYNIRFKVLNPEILKYEYTGKFRETESITEILDIISISKPFKFKSNKNEITIY